MASRPDLPVSTVVLVRHGLTSMTGPLLAGRTPGIHLDDRGRRQAGVVAARLAAVPLGAVVTSPLERCRETLEPLLADRPELSEKVDDRLVECGYGDWTGRELKALAKDPLWPAVQAHPSSVTFPGDGGEAMRAMQARAVDAVRSRNAALPDGAVWLACSHGDVIKAIVADALGLHLDGFQRIVVDPASITIIRYTGTRPFLERLNDTGGDAAALAGLLAPSKKRRSRPSDGDAAVGGGAGAP